MIPSCFEIGNSTCKRGRRGAEGWSVERFGSFEELLERVDATDRGGVVVGVGSGREEEVEMLAEAISGRLFQRTEAGSFIGDSYDTPERLGLDRILNLAGLGGDGVAISCGTAITVDATVGGRPYWGAILPGFTTSTDALHLRIPLLPRVTAAAIPRLPARSTTASVVNGTLLGTAMAVQGLARQLWNAADGRLAPRVILTGGEAELLARLWEEEPRPEVREALLFEGLERFLG